MVNVIFLKLFSLLSFSFLILLSLTFPIKSFSFTQQNFEQPAIDQPAIAQLPSPDEKNKIGYIILSTNVINDNGGNKQPSDFTINIHDTSAFPSSLKVFHHHKFKLFLLMKVNTRFR